MSYGTMSQVLRANLGGSSTSFRGTSAPITDKELRIADNSFLKCCRRCGGIYETKTRRQPVMKLCQDCKDVLPAVERRGYMDRAARA
ncbi:hypothetical protein HYP71_gp049 [Arthrobacter phage KBurrousTX]|uniref:Uncharacterized protein n=1 Tax=Arthrobacter phage KBurrousTX TaxID=2315608 RepID=A0A386K8K6_9CAUD|nr:hypothetical protein HYP71_gp049 [Arthrobacter phage KBurrousTX]AYD81543.1 hypothetical protein KBurrousTX_49 [Arthrobacter phage KBurrousTX]